MHSQRIHNIWPLVLTAPEEREWGFWSRLGQFCPWRPFVAHVTIGQPLDTEGSDS